MQYLNMPKKESIHKEFYYNNNIISFFVISIGSDFISTDSCFGVGEHPEEEKIKLKINRK